MFCNHPVHLSLHYKWHREFWDQFFEADSYARIRKMQYSVCVSTLLRVFWQFKWNCVLCVQCLMRRERINGYLIQFTRDSRWNKTDFVGNFRAHQREMEMAMQQYAYFISAETCKCCIIHAHTNQWNGVRERDRENELKMSRVVVVVAPSPILYLSRVQTVAISAFPIINKINYLRPTWSWVSPMQTCSFCRRRNRWSRRRRKQIHEASDWNRIVCLWPQHSTTRFVCRFYISLWAFTRRQRNNVSDYMLVAEHVNAAQLNQIPASVCVQIGCCEAQQAYTSP